MKYIRHAVSPPLNQYINYFYYLEGPLQNPFTKVLPLPVVDMKFNLGGDLFVHEVITGKRQRFSGSWVTGIWDKPHVVYWPFDLKLFGVNFRPCGAYPFLQIPLSKFRNNAIQLDLIWTGSASEVCEKLVNAEIEQGFHILQSFFLDLLPKVPQEFNVAQHATDQIIRNHGVIPIKTLSDRLALSQNHLGRLMKKMVGASPKELARFQRFHQVLQEVNPEKSVNWLQLSHERGYYDQSHLNKDFTAFTGHSPTEYMAIRKREYSEIEKSDRILRILSIG